MGTYINAFAIINNSAKLENKCTSSYIVIYFQYVILSCNIVFFQGKSWKINEIQIYYVKVLIYFGYIYI